MQAEPIVNWLIEKVGSRKIIIFAIFYYLFTLGQIEALHLTIIGVATVLALAIPDAAKNVGNAMIQSAKIKGQELVPVSKKNTRSTF